MIPVVRQGWFICTISTLLIFSPINSVSSSYIPPSLFGGGGYGGGSSGSSGGGYGGGSAGGGGGSGPGPVTTAIESTRTVEVKPVQMMSEPHEPQVVEVPSEDMPVTVHFKSQSSRVLVQQTHTPAQIAEPEHTTSEDEPQRVIHEVVKPVIQEIREIIQPYRRLIQQVQPVIEQTHTVIAKGEPRPAVEPIPVEGASPGTLSGRPSGAGAGAGGRGGAGGNKYGGGSYAASASSVQAVQMKSGQPSYSQQSSAEVTEPRKSSIRQQSSSSSFSMQPVSKAVQNQKYGQQMVSQPPRSQASNAYASRRGDFREPTHMEKFDTPARMTLRPAPQSMNVKPTPAKVSLKTPVPAQPMEAYQQPRIESRFDEQPSQPEPVYAYPVQYDPSSYSIPYENLSPLVTFIAQPVRFRARA